MVVFNVTCNLELEVEKKWSNGIDKKLYASKEDKVIFANALGENDSLKIFSGKQLKKIFAWPKNKKFNSKKPAL